MKCMQQYTTSENIVLMAPYYTSTENRNILFMNTFLNSKVLVVTLII